MTVRMIDFVMSPDCTSGCGHTSILQPPGACRSVVESLERLDDLGPFHRHLASRPFARGLVIEPGILPLRILPGGSATGLDRFLRGQTTVQHCGNLRDPD